MGKLCERLDASDDARKLYPMLAIKENYKAPMAISGSGRYLLSEFIEEQLASLLNGFWCPACGCAMIYCKNDNYFRCVNCGLMGFVREAKA
jgi:hypothetical protein